MAKLSLLFVMVVTTLAVCVIAHERAEAEGQQHYGGEQHRAKRQSGLAGGDVYPASDVSLLQKVFRAPLKRQWCRAGMSYNPVLGMCTMSLAAMRGRARSFRGA